MIAEALDNRPKPHFFQFWTVIYLLKQPKLHFFTAFGQLSYKSLLSFAVVPNF